MTNDTDTFTDQQIWKRAQAISDRWPLTFDPESDWGMGTLEALAVLDLVAERDTKHAYRGTQERRRLHVQLMIEALQAYDEELAAPTCYDCSTLLTNVTTDIFGQPTHCPTCDKTRDVKR